MTGPKLPESKVTEVTKPVEAKGLVECKLSWDHLVLLAQIIDRVQFQGKERQALMQLDIALQEQADEIKKHSNVTTLPTAG